MRRQLLDVEIVGRAAIAPLLRQGDHLLLGIGIGLRQGQAVLQVAQLDVGLGDLRRERDARILDLGKGRLGLVAGALDRAARAAKQVYLPGGVEIGAVEAGRGVGGRWGCGGGCRRRGCAAAAQAGEQGGRGAVNVQIGRRCAGGRQKIGAGAAQAGARFAQARLGGRQVGTAGQGQVLDMVEFGVVERRPPLRQQGALTGGITQIAGAMEGGHRRHDTGRAAIVRSDGAARRHGGQGGENDQVLEFHSPTPACWPGFGALSKKTSGVMAIRQTPRIQKASE